MRSTILRRALFCLCLLAAGTGFFCYVHWWRHSEAQTFRPDAGANLNRASEWETLRQRPYLAFRHTGLGSNHGCVAYVPLDAPRGPRRLTSLPSDRIYMTASIGVSLQAFRGVFTTYRAAVFDRDGVVGTNFHLAGVPSRVRVARDGSRAATTVFVSGDSYNAGGFSTRTTLFDLRAALRIADLEEFKVRRDGQIFKKADFNFWGVTFGADPDEFYATLGTGGVFHLVRGKVSTRELVMVREAVECPSLSPDESKVAFKSRLFQAGRLIWNVHVLDLRSGAEFKINEDRSVDDQVEWLDDGHLLYALPRNKQGSGSSDIWMARLDGSTIPELWVADGASPCVVR